MLIEREVSTKAAWEKELPKIVFDPRYKLLPQQALRRLVFQKYQRTRADEEKLEKKTQLARAARVLNPKLDSEKFRKGCTAKTTAADVLQYLKPKSAEGKLWVSLDAKDQVTPNDLTSI